MAVLEDRVVLVTGASSGIGEACARAFAREGARLLLAARRVERVRAAAPGLSALGARGVRAVRLDTREPDAVRKAFDDLPAEWREIEALVNNAGLSRGLGPLHEGSLDDWNEMIDTNVKGLLHVDRVVVPGMAARGTGIVIHIGSIAGRQAYPGGNVYCASKFAVTALGRALAIDTLGTGVRVSSVDPGMVETEFSEVRFHGDRGRAAGVYQGLEPLRPEDVAEVVVWIASRPAHVQIAEVVVLPSDQASATHVHRRA